MNRDANTTVLFATHMVQVLGRGVERGLSEREIFALVVLSLAIGTEIVTPRTLQKLMGCSHLEVLTTLEGLRGRSLAVKSRRIAMPMSRPWRLSRLGRRFLGELESIGGENDYVSPGEIADVFLPIRESLKRK